MGYGDLFIAGALGALLARRVGRSLQRYQGGAVGYLEVVTAQSAALTNERTAIDIARRRLDASVLLVKALGGLWDSPATAMNDSSQAPKRVNGQ